MSKPLTIEEESGTVTRARHPHNGYYAGDFSGTPFSAVARTSAHGVAGLRTQQVAA